MTETKPALPSAIAANIGHFTGRTWLLPTLLDWYEKDNERIFLLTGGPGTGKSMISAWLARFGPVPADPVAADQLERLRAQIKAIHFCVAASGSTDPKEMARQIAVQLTRNVSGFGEALAATLGDQAQIVTEQQIGHVEAGGSVTGVYIASLNLSGLSEELSFNRTLRDPLKRLYEDGYDKPMLLTLDALDETLAYAGGTNIVKLLAKLIDLPPQVRILATTRPDPRVLMLFPEARAFDLNKDAPQNVDDVKQYVLEQLPMKDGLGDEQRALLAKRLSDASKGIFLYAYMVLDDLLPRLPQIPDLETYPLPDGLSGLYRDFLNREIGQDDDRWYESFKPVLGLIAVAQWEGLTQTQLRAISRRDVEQPLRKCKQYLVGELPEGPFRVFHKSFADFLLEDEDNIHRHIDAPTMHGQIADYYWEKHHDNWQGFDAYGLNALATHFYRSEQSGRLAELINQEWMAARFRGNHYTYDGYLTDLQLAWEDAKNTARTERDSLVNCLRYALIQDQIGRHVQHYPPSLVARALTTGMWSAERALSVLAKVDDHRQSAQMAAVLLETKELDPKQVDWVVRHGLEAVFSDFFLSVGEREELLTSLIPYLNSELQEKVLDFVLAQDPLGEEGKTATICVLALHLDEHLLPRVVEYALSIQDEDFRVRALAGVAPRLNGDLIDRVLRSAKQLKTTQAQAQLLVKLIPNLIQRQRFPCARQVLNAALSLPLTEDYRASAPKDELQYIVPRLGILIEVLPFLSKQKKNWLVGLILQESQELQSIAPRRHGLWAEVVTRLLPSLTEAQVERALEQSRQAVVLMERIQLYAALAPRLDRIKRSEVIDECLACVLGLYGYERSEAIKSLLPLLDDINREHLFERLWAETARTFTELPRDPSVEGFDAMEFLYKSSYQTELVSMLSVLIHHLPESSQQRACRNMLSLPTPRLCRQAVEQLADILTESGLREALTLMEYKDDHALIFYSVIQARLSVHLTVTEQEPVRRHALEAALSIDDGHQRATTLMEICTYLGTGSELLNRCLESIPQLPAVGWGWSPGGGMMTAHPSNEWNPRAYTLAKLVPRLVGEQIGLAFEIALTFAVERYAAHVLCALIPRLADSDVPRCLDLGWSYKNRLVRATILSALVPRLNGEDRKKALEECKQTIELHQVVGEKVDAIVSVLPYLSVIEQKTCLQIALDDVFLSKSEAQCETALLSLLEHVPIAWYQDILAKVAEMLSDEDYGVWSSHIGSPRAGALVALATHCPEEMLPEVLRLALGLPAGSSGRVRIRVLLALLPRLRGSDFQRALSDCIELALKAPEIDPNMKGNPRALYLRLLAPYLPENVWHNTFQQAQNLREEWRAWTLVMFLKSAPDSIVVRRAIRDSISTYLSSLQGGDGSNLLEFLAQKELLIPAIFSDYELHIISQLLMDIFEKWHWL